MAAKPRIVVVGGGAAGLELVARLGRKLARRGRAEVILVERNRSHIWKPLLHEVASGALDSSLDEVGYRSHAHRYGYRYFPRALEAIDRDAQAVVLAPIVDEDGEEVMGRYRLSYDWLVIAIGSVSNDFGTPGVAEHCIYLDQRRQAERFRQKLLNLCLKVSQQVSDDPASDAKVRVAIVGGGATGVELSAELYNAARELAHYGLERFDNSRMDVTLVEAGPRILPAVPERVSDAAHKELERIGVHVRTATRIVACTPQGMQTADGDLIAAPLRVWAAGIKAPDFLKDIAGLETNRLNQLVVTPELRTSRDPRIFAIGDCCSCALPGWERPVPPRAQAAHQMASRTARNLAALLAGRPLKPFVYKDHGSLVSLSHYSTIGSLMGNLVGGSMRVEGRIARFVYVSLYRLHLIAVHGWLRAIAMILVGHINRVIRPRIKLH
ncbi:MAG: NAD(P)/FAD-dependent oxidoreductase [Alphaproteobacteria bacterium]